MFKKFITLVFFMLVNSASHANLIKLDFDVNGQLRLPGGSPHVPINEQFVNAILVDMSNPNWISSSTPNGGETFSLNFSPVNVQETPFTEDVQSHIIGDVSQRQLWTVANTYSTYEPNGFNGSGKPETSIHLSFFEDLSVRNTNTVLLEEYRRGISLHSIVPGKVIISNEDSFQAYIISLIDLSNFFYSEMYLNTSVSPITSYGYNGSATLTNVSSVPIPAAIWLFMSGLVFLRVGLAKRDGVCNPILSI